MRSVRIALDVVPVSVPAVLRECAPPQDFFAALCDDVPDLCCQFVFGVQLDKPLIGFERVFLDRHFIGRLWWQAAEEIFGQGAISFGRDRDTWRRRRHGGYRRIK
jgi:hypothetical protein